MSWKEPFLGIDFGTAFSVMASIHPESGQAAIIRNCEGEETTRSVVYYGKDANYVGQLAEEYLEEPSEYARVVLSSKPDIGKKRVDSVIDSKLITPFLVAVEVFSKLKRDAEKGEFNDTPVKRAVVTIPASFDPVQVDAIQAAALKAGFHEVKTLEEPVAAAIAYLKAGIDVGQRILVFDLGAGTFDVAVLERTEDNVTPFQQIVKPQGQTYGGDKFDLLLRDYVLEQLSDELPGDPFFLNYLLRLCRRAKEALTQLNKYTLKGSLPDGTRFQQEILRGTFEKLIQVPLDKMLQQSAELAKSVKEKGDPIDTVVLIGGSSRIPLVAKRLHKTLQLKPRAWQEQDVAVALGAAHYGEIVWGAKSVKEYRETIQAIVRTASAENHELIHLRQIKAERDRLKVSAKDGKHLELEILKGSLGQRLTSALKLAKAEYKKTLRDILDPDLITEDDFKTLEVRSKTLGLTENETGKIEAVVFGHTVQQVLEKQQLEKKKSYKKHVRRARLQILRKKWEDASGYAQAAINTDPTKLAGFELLTDIRQQQEKWELAIDAATRCLQVAPENHAIRYRRARFHLEEHCYKSALADFDHVAAFELKGKEHRFSWRAVAKYHLGDVSGAVADLELAANDQAGCLKDGPSPVAVWTITGFLFIGLKNFTKARVYLSKALILRGEMHENNGDFWGYFHQKQSKNGLLAEFSSELLSAGKPKIAIFYGIVQLKLWNVLHCLNPQSLADAVEQFDISVKESKCEISPAVYAKLISQDRNKAFGVEVVKRFARTGRCENAIKLIDRLVADLNFNVALLLGSSAIASSNKLSDYLTPNFLVDVAYGSIFNSLTVTNLSRFPLTMIVIYIRVRRKDGTVITDKKEIKKLGSFQNKTWSRYFKDPGFGGHLIKKVSVELSCEQGQKRTRRIFP